MRLLTVLLVILATCSSAAAHLDSTPHHHPGDLILLGLAPIIIGLAYLLWRRVK